MQKTAQTQSSVLQPSALRGSRTTPRTRRRFAYCLLHTAFCLLPLLSTRSAMADDLVNDARLEGYGGGKGILDVGGATYYLLTGALGVLAVSVMFKDAKRANAKK